MIALIVLVVLLLAVATALFAAAFIAAGGRWEAGDLHDGATMRAEHRERHLRIAEQADTAADEFRRGAS